MTNRRPNNENAKAMHGVDIDIGRVWHGVTGRMWERQPGPFERLVRRLSGSPAVARALVATPSLLMAWLIASVLIVVLGAFITEVAGQPLIPLLAPVLAGTGVAFAYGAAADPAWEITRSVAFPQHLLLIVRVAAVFLTNSVIGIGASLATGSAVGITFLWLIPMASVSLVALAAALWTESPVIGSAVAMIVWLGFILRSAVTDRLGQAIAASEIRAALPVYALLAAVSAALILSAITQPTMKGLRS